MRAASPILDTVRQDWIHLVLAPMWALVLGELSSKALAVTLLVSLMHFWYDGFVWSVRRNQV